MTDDDVWTVHIVQSFFYKLLIILCHTKEQSGSVSQLAENSGQRHDGDEKTLTYLLFI